MKKDLITKYFSNSGMGGEPSRVSNPEHPPNLEGYSIEVNNLTKKFGDFTAVNSISFKVKKGEIFGFLGANGAGKSTAIRMLCGILEPTSGDALVSGFSVMNEPDNVKQNIGYMSQRFSLYNDLTVEENINFFGGVYGLEGNHFKERKKWVLKIVSVLRLLL